VIPMDLAKLLIETGALGLAALLVFELRELRRIIYTAGEKFLYLASVIHDHKARSGDETPPERPFVQRPHP